jgi:hypothetical protein
MGSETTEKRRHPRSKTGLPVEIKQSHQKYGIRGQTADLSLSGFYFETMLLWPLNRRFWIRLWIGDHVVDCDAMVRTCDPGVGIGFEFLFLSDHSRELLSQHLASLDREAEAQKE